MASGPSFDAERVAHYEGKTTVAGAMQCMLLLLLLLILCSFGQYCNCVAHNLHICAPVSVSVYSRRDRHGCSIRRSAVWVSDPAPLPAGAISCFMFRCPVPDATCGICCFTLP